jgi:Holliday junction resolvase RusA-like endonuclease/endogenous inhibitor of DNA gyrase (YacG/DUF329 family)
MARRSIIERGLEPAPGRVTPLGDRLVGTELIRVHAHGDPSTKARPRLGQGRTYTPARTRAAEQALRWEFLAARAEPDADHELAVDVTFRTSTRQRRDLDNLLKLLLDAANGWLWRDDVQVVEINARVERGHPDAGTQLVVRRIRRYTSDCDTCGRIITPRPGASRGPAYGGGRYCSRACYDHAQRKGNIAPCEVCGEPVYRQRSRGETRRFCSTRCRGIYLGARLDRDAASGRYTKVDP